MDKDQITAEVFALDQQQPRLNRELSLGRQSRDHEEQKIRFDVACEELCGRLRESGGTAAFEALFALACYNFSPDFDPYVGMPIGVAGQILYYVQPPCSLSCEDAVRAVSLSQWSPNLKEVAWYLGAHFGLDAVYKTVAAVEKEAFVVEIKRQQTIWRHEIEAATDTQALPIWEGL